MAQEIERKFLVIGDTFKAQAFTQSHIRQGYLSSVPVRTVRIRINGNEGFITVKGIGNDTGTTRFEWEKSISLNDAEALLKLCEPGVIDKLRYKVRSGNHVVEVDEFHGDNEGLVVAEVELTDEQDHFDTPSWLGKEVTGDPKYYNAALMKNPFTKWQSK